MEGRELLMKDRKETLSIVILVFSQLNSIDVRLEFRIFCLALSAWLGGFAFCCGDAEDSLPPPFAGEIDFGRDIAPILESKCVKCHGKGKRKGGFNLDSRERILQEADSGPAIQLGNSAESYLVQLVAGVDPENVMPQKGSRLTKKEVGFIRTWIDRGLPWKEGIRFSKKPPLNLKPRRPAVPKKENGFIRRNPVDAFMLSYFEKEGFVPPDPVDDRVYARRVYLDAVGLLPSVEELKAFVADRSFDKRPRLAERLLNDRRNYAEHWLTFWNDLLRNDYRGTGFIDGGRKQISAWLYQALADNQPYDLFVRNLVTEAPGAEGFIKGIIWRGVVNASQTPNMQAAQNVSQVFLGVNLKCASCHDSFINDWNLEDAYGMAGIFAEGPLEIFQCDKPTGKTSQARFLHPNLGTVDAKMPRKERMKTLAAIMTGRENGRLSRTIVNRLWAKFFGRGLVPTLDDMEQPSWHPDLLDWLAADLADHAYDLKHTMALLLTSQTYQLPSRPAPERMETAEVFRGPLTRRMTAEQFVDALGSFTGRGFQTPANDAIDLSAGLSVDHIRFLREQTRKARWISMKTSDGEKAEAAFFRKRFQTDGLLKTADAYVAAADSFYLFVNGKQAGKGRGRAEVFRFDLQNYLVEGSNLIALKVVRSEERENPAAAFALIRLGQGERGEEKFRYLGSDETWICHAEGAPGWEKENLETSEWDQAVELGDARRGPANIEPRLIAKISAADQFGAIRASLAASDPLTRALGRPNREQVVTDRASNATTLQSLELTNGNTLAEKLSAIAGDLIAQKMERPRKIVEHLFWVGLGRAPSQSETKACAAFLSEGLTQKAVEDLLWTVAMLPEFQLVL